LERNVSRQSVSPSDVSSIPKYRVYLSLPPIDIQQRYTVPEASLYLRQSIAKTYLDISGGRLKILKDGARTYVHGSEIARVSAGAEAA
jgi:hypothetical protein